MPRDIHTHTHRCVHLICMHLTFLVSNNFLLLLTLCNWLTLVPTERTLWPLQIKRRKGDVCHRPYQRSIRSARTHMPPNQVLPMLCHAMLCAIFYFIYIILHFIWNRCISLCCDSSNGVEKFQSLQLTSFVLANAGDSIPSHVICVRVCRQTYKRACISGAFHKDIPTCCLYFNWAFERMLA